MQVKTFSNNLAYMSYDCWQQFWDSRGYLPKNRRTAETDKNGHRALSKPIMTGERLAYDEAEDCFILHWYVRGSDMPVSNSGPSVVFKCYRNMWRIYPNNENQVSDWNTRGKVARINKYIPLTSYMHIDRGETIAYGFGRIFNGAVVTRTNQMQFIRNTGNCLNQSIGSALNYGTAPSLSSRGLNVRTQDHREAHDLNYTREVLSRLVSKYVDENIDELFLKCAALVHGFTPEEDDISDMCQNWIKKNYFKHQVFFPTTLNVISSINGVGIQTAGVPIAGLFGLNIGSDASDGAATLTDFMGYPYKSGIVQIENSDYRSHRGLATEPKYGTPEMLMRHVTSYFYMKNIFKPLGGGTHSAGDAPTHDVVGSHGLFFLFLLVYCVDSVHGFTAMAKLLFGKSAYNYLCNFPKLRRNDKEDMLVRVAEVFARHPQRVKIENANIGKEVECLYKKLFSSSLIEKFSNRVMYNGVSSQVIRDRSNAENMRNFSQYKDIMREVFEVFLTTGVSYADFGLSPYMAHLSNDLVVEHGSAYSLSNSCTTPTVDYTCQTSLLSADCITESNPLVRAGYFADSEEPLHISKKEDKPYYHQWADSILKETCE